jgi:hypothetical protein
LERRRDSKKGRYYNDTNSWVLEPRVKACLLEREREREREREICCSSSPSQKNRGRNKIGYLLTPVLLPYFFTLGKNGHETMVIQVS